MTDMTNQPAPLSHAARLVTAIVAVNAALPFLLAPLVKIGGTPIVQSAIFLLCTGAIFALNEGLARSYPAQRFAIRTLSFLNLLAGLAFGVVGLVRALPILPMLFQ
ncbi:MAG: hypothetical protein ACRBBV_03765 [Paracoccaceae bacterium]